MSQELLDRAQVGAPLQHVGRKRVAERVWRDMAGHGRLAHPPIQTASDVGGREPPPTARQEQRRLVRIRHERRAGVAQIALQRSLGRLPHRHDARLAALAGHAQTLSDSKSGASASRLIDLLGAQAARIGELEHRPVPDLEGSRGRNLIEKPGDLVRSQDPGEPRRLLRHRQELGRVLRRLAPIARGGRGGRGRRRACARRSRARARAQRARRRRRAGRGRRGSPAPCRVASPTRRARPGQPP